MSSNPSQSTMSLDVDVRVWYTLDSSPHRMLAPLGRLTTVDVPPPPPTASQQPRFAKITLKTCLSAICISSPELILDRSRDYTLYVVDPEQSYKAGLRGGNKQSQPQQQQQNQHGQSSTSRAREPSRDNCVVVGKGFLRWILEEEGDGDTFVVGRVNEEDGDDAYLDVEIRMKETKAQSREHYFTMLREFGGGGNSSNDQKPAFFKPQPPPPAPSRPKKRRATQHQQHVGSSSPYPTSSPAATSSPPKARNQPLPPPPQQAQAMQILQLLQALQARQNANAAAPAPEPSTTAPATQPTQALLTQALEALGAGAGTSATAAQLLPSTSAQSSSSSLDQLQSLLGASQPATSNVPAAAPSTSAASPTPTTMLQCYNCGVEDTNKATWRLVTLAPNQRVRYPRAFECDPSRSMANANDKQDPPMDSQGHAIANGRTSWRACNRCGLFWTKWKTNRPETLEKKRGTKRKTRPSLGPLPNTQHPTPQQQQQDDDERDEIQDSSPPRAGHFQPPNLTAPVASQSIPPLPPPTLLPKKKKRIRKSTAMELVQDKNGIWRSKRSVQENPEGRRPGRPAGCKTGEGQGKSRDHKKRAAKTAGSDGDNSASPVPRTQHHLVAQSSPVRRSFPWDTSSGGGTGTPSGSAWSKHNGAPFAMGTFHSTPGMSPTRRRYGAPSHILNSSPSTALDALLSEGGDFNFDFSHPSAAAALFDTAGGSPLRRSPRKNPNGTRGEQRNPYATTVGASGSPLGKKTGDLLQAGSSPPDDPSTSASPMLDMDLFTAFTNFKSPGSNHFPSPAAAPAAKQPTKSRALAATSSSSPPRSQEEEDDDDETITRNPLDSGILTSLTSPGSPSPTRNRFEAKLTRESRRGTNSSNSAANTPLRSGGADDADAEEEDDDDDDGHGPDSPTTARQERLGSQRCPASPSLGQKRKRDAAAAVAGSGATTPRRRHDSHVLTEGPSPATSLLSGKGPAPALTPRSGKVSPAKSLALLRASMSPAQKKAFAALSPQQQQQVVRRKPLPATVEDAPSSSAGSSRGDDEDDEEEDGLSPYDHGTVESFLDMLEDPYGLLAANGIGLGQMGSGSIEINGVAAGGSNSAATQQQQQQQVSAAGDASGSNTGAVSVDHFAGGVQLHDRQQFGSHLRDFTNEGSKGVAAYALPGVTPVPTTSATETKADAASTTPTKAKTAGGATPLLRSTPSKATRSSPRNRAQSPQSPKRPSNSASTTSMAPPTTPRRTALNDSPSKLLLMKTPTSNSKNNALALASAVARSPALQRMLNGTSMSPSNGSGGALDFSTLFGSGGVAPGTFSPFVMPSAHALSGLRTPTGGSSGGGGVFNFATPLSPSLSRLLNTMENGGSSTNAEHNALTTTLSDEDKSVAGTRPTDMPAEAFAELQAMFQDANFAAFFEGVSQQIHQQQQHGGGGGGADNDAENHVLTPGPIDEIRRRSCRSRSQTRERRVSGGGGGGSGTPATPSRGQTASRV